MELHHIAQRFADNEHAIRALVSNVTPNQARWRPGEGAWSLLEVINHLHDEERRDFRTRLDMVLHAPGEQWPSIDPASWIVEFNYNERDLDQSVENFSRERTKSVDWLRQLKDPNWDAAYEHPKLGTITARDLMASWLAHDGLHLRQIAKLHFAYVSVLVPNGSTKYAGDW